MSAVQLSEKFVFRIDIFSWIKEHIIMINRYVTNNRVSKSIEKKTELKRKIDKPNMAGRDLNKKEVKHKDNESINWGHLY